MKKLKRILSAVILFCMLVSLIPTQVFAQEGANATYVLDTNGLDIGAEYLIVYPQIPYAQTVPVAYHALTGDKNNAGKNKEIQIDGNQVVAFDEIDDYLWMVESADAAGDNAAISLRHDTGYLNIDQSKTTVLPISYGATKQALYVGHGNKAVEGNGEYIIYSKNADNPSYMFHLAASTSYNPMFGSKGITSFSYVNGMRFYKKVVPCTVTFNGNGYTDGTVPATLTANAGGTVQIPSGDSLSKTGFAFSHWTDNQDGTGTRYEPGNTMTVSRSVTLYAQWTPLAKPQATVNTICNNVYADINAILGGDQTLVLRLDDGDGTIIPLTRIETGVYTTEVKNGTYSVYILNSDNSYVDTDKNVVVNNTAASVDISYYSVSYDAAGGNLNGVESHKNYPAGTRLIAIAQPLKDDHEFLGWMDQNGNIVAVGDVVTESLQEETILTAQWKQIELDASLKTNYVIRYLVKGTYERVHPEAKVQGAAIGAKVYATQNALTIPKYTYCGATINGVYYPKEQNPYITLSANESENVIIIHYMPDPDLHLHKEATLENDGTYTIQLEMFTHDNPITTIIDQNTPLDIVLVLDQSSSIQSSRITQDRDDAVKTFIQLVAEHGRANETDHRLAIVTYADNGDSSASGVGNISGSFDKVTQQTVKADNKIWTNTGVFDSDGDFHAYPIKGFVYTEFNGNPSHTDVDDDGNKVVYYTFDKEHNDYLLLDYYDEYFHLIDEKKAIIQSADGATIYGYINDSFVELERDAGSGMWKQKNTNVLYTITEFFLKYEKVWTHRYGVEERQIHAYTVNGVYTPVDGHDSLFTRAEAKPGETYQKSVYHDALIPVTKGANGSGTIDPCIDKMVENFGAKGQTYVSYGMEMANSIFADNPLTDKDKADGRQRVVVVFTDGKPGDSTSFDEDESARAIYQSSIASGTHGALVFTVGLYGKEIVSAESDQDYFMNGLSSNYPNATRLEDVWAGIQYIPAQSGMNLDMGGAYYVKVGDQYRKIKKVVSTDPNNPTDKTYYNLWTYQDLSDNQIVLTKTSLNTYPVITAVEVDGEIKNQVNGVDIYRKSGDGYQAAASDKYYLKTDDVAQLEEYFATIVRELTTKVSEEVTMENDAILRDIMGQGLVLTPGTVITVYTEEGTFISNEKRVEWSGRWNVLDSLTIPANPSGTLYSNNGIEVDGYDKPIPYISVYNLDSQNPTDPNGADYHPHTVDIVGYDYGSKEWYLNAESPTGKRLIVTITHVEARDDVVWGRPETTNHNQSGLWLRHTDEHDRELLEAFEQPSTVFVEYAYVLDYGKAFDLSGWYFDHHVETGSGAIHVDFEIANGMNLFDPNAPITQNGNGNLKYGNIKIQDGVATYQPTTTQWGGYDQFYLFGRTDAEIITKLSANQNGNLWNKITVIPANNIYYEDSFITGSSGGANDISGFQYTGVWDTVFSGEKGEAGNNKEHPENTEDTTAGGGAHGWTDGLADDVGFSDGSAFMAGINETQGATAEFTFTGTGVDVYTRTNRKSGLIIAMLSGTNLEGKTVTKSFVMDNLAMSGDYYQIPTVSFDNLDYGTYKVTLIATAGRPLDAEDLQEGEESKKRYEYYLDGIRVYNPLCADALDQTVVYDAYGKENNAIFTELRDIILTYDAFFPDRTDIGATGAVFIDWLKDGQGTGSDELGTGTNTVEIGKTYNTYGPKNEIYLAPGQGVVLMVDPNNHYFVGMKSLDGTPVKVGLGGQETKEITVGHTTDMYYEIVPSALMADDDMEGYIAIWNISETESARLALTKLRTTNTSHKITNNGILPIIADSAVEAAEQFDAALEEAKNRPVEPPVEDLDPFEVQKQQTSQLFTTVRNWLEEEEGGAT